MTADEAREQTITVAGTAAMVPPGRTSDQGFASFWPTPADKQPDSKGHAVARWLDVVDKTVFYRACGRPALDLAVRG
jgi:hypothetical protein